MQGNLLVDEETGYATLKDAYKTMDWAGVGRRAFPSDGYLYKFGENGVPIHHLSRNRPNDSGILHGGITEAERMAADAA